MIICIYGREVQILFGSNFWICDKKLNMRKARDIRDLKRFNSNDITIGMMGIHGKNNSSPFAQLVGSSPT